MFPLYKKNQNKLKQIKKQVKMLENYEKSLREWTNMQEINDQWKTLINKYEKN